MLRDEYRATLLVMFGLAAASLTGFLRQATIAYELGAGRTADIYLIAFTIPEFVFIALPIVLSPAFIPPFAAFRQLAGERAAWRLGLRVGGALLALLLAFGALAALGAPVYVAWLSPGFDPHARAQAAEATRLMLPAISLMGLATLAGAALQVYRRFARPALATAVYNLAFITTLLALPVASPLLRAAWGVTLGAIAALGLQLPLLWAHRPRPQPSQLPSGVHSPPSLGKVASLAAPLAAGYFAHHVILFVDRAMATVLGAGSAASLNYAYHLALVVGQLSGLAVSTAVFPRLAEHVAGDNVAGARASLSSALSLVWALGLPMTCGLILLRIPVVRILFEHGAFGQSATDSVSSPLVWYGLGVLADALCQPLWRVVYAQQKPWTVLGVNGLQTGVRLLGNVAFSYPLGYNGLALSAALGLSAQAVVLALLVRRRLGAYLTAAWWHDAGRVALAAALAATAIHLLGTRLSSAPAIVTLSAGGGLGAFTYVASLWLLKHKGGRRPSARTNGSPDNG